MEDRRKSVYRGLVVREYHVVSPFPSQSCGMSELHMNFTYQLRINPARPCSVLVT